MNEAQREIYMFLCVTGRPDEAAEFKAFCERVPSDTPQAPVEEDDYE